MLELLLRNGDAARVAGRYREAEARYGAARRRLRSASLVSCLEAGHLYSRMASLRIDQWRPQDAWTLLMRAESIAEGYGDKALSAAVLLKMGIAAENMGEPELAVRKLLDAKAAYRRLGNPAMDVAVLNSLAVTLAGAGEIDRALRLHVVGERPARELLSPAALLTYEWARGYITLRAGYHGAALAIFDRVLEQQAAAGDVPSAAEMLVDLAEAQASVGDLAAVEETAVQMAVLFDALPVPAGVMAAAQLLHQATACRLGAALDCVRLIRAFRRSSRPDRCAAPPPDRRRAAGTP